jgi:shikimate kinase
MKSYRRYLHFNTKTCRAYAIPASGATRKVAEALAETAGADLYEIKPQATYTKADLDWQDKKSRSSIEMSDKSSRPAIAGTGANVGAYGMVFVGFPIWWYVAPAIINTFLESYDFAGKTIVPFAMSGSGGIGETVAHLKGSVDASATIREGKMLNGLQTKESLTAWVDSLGLMNSRGIVLVGLNGTGKSMLGRLLAKKLGIRLMEVEDYWFPLKYDYNHPRTNEEAAAMMLADIESSPSGFVITGNVSSLGLEVAKHIRLAVHMTATTEARMRRLEQTEGHRRSKKVPEEEQAFMAYARNRTTEPIENWLAALDCASLTVDGTCDLEENAKRIIKEYEQTP